MSRPIFTPTDVQEIREAGNPSDVTHAQSTDAVLRVKNTVLGIPAGTLIVTRSTSIAEPGQTVVVYVDGLHTLKRAPVDMGTVVGVVLGVLEEVQSDA